MRSPLSSGNESDESSDIDGNGIEKSCGGNNVKRSLVNQSTDIASNNCSDILNIKKNSFSKESALTNQKNNSDNNSPAKKNKSQTLTKVCSPSDLSGIPQGVLLQLIESGHLQVHTEEGIIIFFFCPSFISIEK